VEKGIRNVKANTGGTIFSRISQCLLYADDVVVLGKAGKLIAGTVEDMTTVTSQIGLTMDISKTKYFILTFWDYLLVPSSRAKQSRS
jgi:hypothetical protein